MSDSATKKKLLAAAVTKLKKQYGESVIVAGNQKNNYNIISSGSMLFDKESGIGGIAKGKITEIFGPEASGKTSFCSSLCANAQEAYPDELILFVDTEHALSLEYAQSFGVDTDPDRFILIQPDTIEEALTVMETMITTGLFSVAVLDSVGASLTIDQLEKGMDENTMGSLAKRMSVGCNKLKNICADTDTAIIFVNQVYSKMGYMANGFETKGGRALKFAASMRIQVGKRDLVSSEDNKEEIIGQGLSFKFIKNKLAAPYKSGETYLYFGKGFDKFREIIELAIEFDFIHQGGAWFSFTTPSGEDMKFQGKSRLLDYLNDSPEDFKMFSKLVRDRLENKDDTTEPVEKEIKCPTPSKKST